MQVDSGINSPASDDVEMRRQVDDTGRKSQYNAANMVLNIPAQVDIGGM